MKHPIPISQIVAAACRHTGCSIEDVLGRSRMPNIVLARELIVHIAYAESNLSYPQITRTIRGPNVGHSTTITAHKRFKDRADDFSVMIHGQLVAFNKHDLVERITAEARQVWVEAIPMAWGNGRATSIPMARARPKPAEPPKTVVRICSRCDGAVAELFTPRGGGRPVCSACRWSDR